MREIAAEPLKLASNRVWRTYSGGRMIDECQGKEDPADGPFPEEWIGSQVRAINPGRDRYPDEGLSVVELPNGQESFLNSLIEEHPVEMLGERHCGKVGPLTGVLVKILDAADRLTIQVHPDRTTAQRLFNSRFGKTEAWYVLGGREIDGEPPHVYLGFKPGVTRSAWRRLFDEQDTAGMRESLHKTWVEPGQVFLVEGGVPHAIGAGCFLVEIQEPTDFTIRTERTTAAGTSVPDRICHQGIGSDRMFDCFSYAPCTHDEAMDRWRLKPLTIETRADSVHTALIRDSDTSYFSMDSYEIGQFCTIDCGDTFSIVIAIGGSGWLVAEHGETPVRQGEFYFLPAGVKRLEGRADGDSALTVVQCFSSERLRT